MSVPALRFRGFVEAWKKQSLGSIFSFKNGVNASKEQYGSGFKFINVLDIINNNFITYDSIIGAVDISTEEFIKNEVQFGDVLFQRSSETREEVGQSNVYIDDKSVTFGGFVIRGRGISEYHPHFFNYVLKTDAVRDEVTQRSGGSTRYNIGQESLNSVELYLPSIPEQKIIANFLMAVDEKITQLAKKRELLAQYKMGLIQKIFSLELRFKDDNGSEFAEWEYVSLDKVLVERKEYAKKNGEYEHISLTVEGVVPKSSRYERDFLVATENKKYKITKLNDICYNPANLKFGVICRNSYGDGVFSPIYVTFEVMGSNVKFIGYLLTRNDFIQYALSFQQGTVYERMAVKPDDFLTLFVSIPSIKEQDKIANFLTAIDDKLTRIQDQLAAAKRYKLGLLQQMFL